MKRTMSLLLATTLLTHADELQSLTDYLDDDDLPPAPVPPAPIYVEPPRPPLPVPYSRRPR